MNDEEFAEQLVDILGSAPGEEVFLEDFLDVAGVYTFQTAGVLTLNSGAVVRMKDGSEFQVTVVRSRKPSS